MREVFVSEVFWLQVVMVMLMMDDDHSWQCSRTMDSILNAAGKGKVRMAGGKTTRAGQEVQECKARKRRQQIKV